MKKMLDINVYAYGNGAANTDCEKGADILKLAIEKENLADECHFNPTLKTHNRKQQIDALLDIAMLNEKLALATKESVLNKRFFITVGGDHTAAIGSWSGAAAALKNIGLIWFDAHMDSHTFETTESKNIHGMPLAVLLGHGEKELTHILSDKPKLKPENVVLIGVRSFEKDEAVLLKKLNVKIFYMDDIKKLGIKKVIEESINIVSKNTNGFGISIDLDGFDPVDAPGVGSPAPDGIRADDFIAEFKAIAKHSKLIGMDIVEFNPVLDVDHKTKKLAVKLYRTLMNIGV